MPFSPPVASGYLDSISIVLHETEQQCTLLASHARFSCVFLLDFQKMWKYVVTASKL